MAVRMDKLTYKAQEALSGAQELARRLNHPQLEPVHLLRSLLAQEEGLIRPLLKKMEVDPQKLIQGVEDLLTRLPRVSGEAQVYLSPGKAAQARAFGMFAAYCARASAGGHACGPVSRRAFP